METWAVNGVDLSSLAWRIEKGEGLMSAPPLIDLDVQLPGRHGVLAATRQVYGPGQLVLNMWVKGVDPNTGLVPGSSTDVDEFHDRVDTLAALFCSPALDVVHTRPNGSVRRAAGKVVAAVDFSRETSSPLFGRFSVAVRLTNPFWADTANRTQTLTLATGASGVLTQFAGATAPMSGTVTFGASSNPQLTQPASGSVLAYDAVISAGRQLTVNTDTLQLGVGSGSAWTPDPTRLRFAGSRSFELAPEVSGPTVALTHTGGGTAQVTFTGPRRFLTP